MYEELVKSLRATVWTDCIDYPDDVKLQCHEAADVIKNMSNLLNKAIHDLHGKCSACKHYSVNHNQGPCWNCIHETCRIRGVVEISDNWEWKEI